MLSPPASFQSFKLKTFCKMLRPVLSPNASLVNVAQLSSGFWGCYSGRPGKEHSGLAGWGGQDPSAWAAFWSPICLQSENVFPLFPQGNGALNMGWHPTSYLPVQSCRKHHFLASFSPCLHSCVPICIENSCGQAFT